MVGIGGSGMSGLAAMLLHQGVRVSGCDMHTSPITRRLQDLGALVTQDESVNTFPEHVHLVAASAAAKPEHPHLTAAVAQGVPVVKYAQLLGHLMGRADGVAISGTHGKSTTTAWLAFVLTEAGLSPNFVVGAISPQLGGGSGVGKGRLFVAEACEYDRSFLHLEPRSAVILNLEEDHLDYYADLADIQRAFVDFSRRLPTGGLLLLNADDAGCRGLSGGWGARCETFGEHPDATWRPEAITVHDGRYAFDLIRDGQRLGRVQLGLPGKHNMSNALAVAALATHHGVAFEPLAAGLRAFRGVGRRLELRGVVDGVTLLDDYAHHPTEIRATLAATRAQYKPQRLWCVFQPHQHSRTRFLLEDFARSFAEADRIVVPDIYFVRDSERDRDEVRAADLVTRIEAAGGDAEYIPDFTAIAAYLEANIRPGDVVITMGAGSIWKLADELVHRLGAHLPT